MNATTIPARASLEDAPRVSLSLRIRTALIVHRINTNRTQAELAEILGLSERTLRRWENGETSPTWEDLDRWHAALETT